MRVWIDPNDLAWFLAWTLRGHSFCPRNKWLIQYCLIHSWHKHSIWLLCLIGAISCQYYQKMTETASCVQHPSLWRCFSAWSVMSTLYWRVVRKWPRKWLWPRWSTHQTQIAQAHTGTSWKDNKRYHSRWGITVSPWWVPCFRKTCGNALGLEPDLSTQSQDPSWLCPGV